MPNNNQLSIYLYGSYTKGKDLKASTDCDLQSSQVKNKITKAFNRSQKTRFSNRKLLPDWPINDL